MINNSNQKTMIIPKLDARVRDLFCILADDILAEPRSTIFTSIAIPFFEKMVSYIEDENVDHDHVMMVLVVAEIEDIKKSLPGYLQ